MGSRLRDKHITLIVTGSIASYKAAEIVRELVREKAVVQVVLTRGAEQFITPMTFQALSGRPVRTDLFSPEQEAAMSHIELGDESDLVIVAPATADFIARMAAGRASDLPGAMLLVTRAPILVCPAMNVNMWEHPLTQRNIATLRDIGVTVLEPEEGELACGWSGKGRLAELHSVMSSVNKLLTRADLAGRTVYVTAGPTQEMLDPIRFLSNTSSGKMGFALAEAAACRGAKVELVSGPVSLRDPFGVSLHKIVSAEEMREKLNQLLRFPTEGESCDILLMAAAVSDMRPSEKNPNKRKDDKGVQGSLALSPNADILREIGEQRDAIEKKRGGEIRLVGFCAESGDETELLHSAREKLSKKRCDLIVANLIDESFRSDMTRTFVLRKDDPSSPLELSGSKIEVADRILNEAAREE